MKFVTFVSLLSGALAASSSCSFSTTITAAAGISQLNACPTLEGDISVSGDGVSGAVDLSSVEEIKADIKFFNSSTATSLILNKLQKISGSLSIDMFTQLFTLDFSSLSEVNELSLVSLPSLSTINLNKGVSKANSIEISDTAIGSLEGLTNYDSVGILNVNNNKNITMIGLNLTEVTENLILSFNSDDCEVYLDQLEIASNLTIQDVAALSLKNLTYVNGTFQIAYNTFEKLDVDTLQEVGSAFQVFANDDLKSVSFADLTKINGELRMSNNTVLEDLGSTFENLTTIAGALNVQGDIANFSLPALKKVAGDFDFTSTNEDFDCSDFEKQQSDGKILGHNFNCTVPEKSSSVSGSGSATSKGSSKTGSSSSDSSSSKKNDGISAHSGSVILAAFFGALLSVFL